ncbi:CBF/Mak21 family-domain-containing protein [Annulohypoxylon nitens]|nr:CBF/Mak21 family-domain-containing protein [Annulohypoxylon nitens]
MVDALVRRGSKDIRQEFCEKFLAEYTDIRFYTFKVLKDIISLDSDESSDEDLFKSAFDLLSFFEDVPDSAEDMSQFYVDAPKKKSDPVKSVNQHKKQAQEAWLALFALDPNREQRKNVLQIMTKSIAPWFTRPELLMDFLTDSYNAGGATSLLALSGVFYLIQERNLDYPSFYRKLYSLLDANILHSKHRSKFFRLLDTFLSSTHLPAVLVASFIKRITRLCLNAPPAAIVVVIPWVYNLFKKHPLCTFMMHRVPRTPEEKEILENEGMADPFIADEEDPMETRAIDSCLWEVVQLQSHYHPNVATIAKIISEQFTKQSYNIEDFLDHSYSSVSQSCRRLAHQFPFCLRISLAARCGTFQASKKASCCGVHDPKESIPPAGSSLGDGRQPSSQALGLSMITGSDVSYSLELWGPRQDSHQDNLKILAGSSLINSIKFALWLSAPILITPSIQWIRGIVR